MSSGTYNDSIPQPNDSISQSQPPILTNFNQLNSVFGIDHVKYDNSTSTSRGRHLKVTFSAPLAMDPNLASPIASLYTKTVTNTELFFQNNTTANDIFQLTNLAVTSTNPITTPTSLPNTQYTILTPWGFKMVGGFLRMATTTVTHIPISSPFTSVIYYALATPEAIGAFSCSIVPGLTTFDLYLGPSSGQTIWYLMIGK